MGISFCESSSIVARDQLRHIDLDQAVACGGSREDKPPNRVCAVGCGPVFHERDLNADAEEFIVGACANFR